MWSGDKRSRFTNYTKSSDATCNTKLSGIVDVFKQIVIIN